MRLLKVGDRTFNLDLLAWFEEGTRDELKPGVRPVLNGHNEVVNPEVTSPTEHSSRGVPEFV